LLKRKGSKSFAVKMLGRRASATEDDDEEPVKRPSQIESVAVATVSAKRATSRFCKRAAKRTVAKATVAVAPHKSCWHAACANSRDDSASQGTERQALGRLARQLIRPSEYHAATSGDGNTDSFTNNGPPSKRPPGQRACCLDDSLRASASQRAKSCDGVHARVGFETNTTSDAGDAQGNAAAEQGAASDGREEQPEEVSERTAD